MILKFPNALIRSHTNRIHFDCSYRRVTKRLKVVLNSYSKNFHNYLKYLHSQLFFLSFISRYKDLNARTVTIELCLRVQLSKIEFFRNHDVCFSRVQV